MCTYSLLARFTYFNLLGIPLVLLTNIALADVGGQVFRDLPLYRDNLNTYGVLDSNERGVAGITVEVTGSNGITQTVQTDANGQWATNSGSLGSRVRLEFKNLPDYLKPSPVAYANNTSVRFVSDDTSNNQFGIHNPADYFNTINPKLITSTYANGDPLAGTDNSDTTLARSHEGLLMFDDSASSPSDGYPFATPADTNLSITKLYQTGAVWGLTYQRSTNTLFTAAFIKRHAGLGSINGAQPTTGGIYAVNTQTNTVTPWLDVNTLASVDTGADPRLEESSTLPPERATPNHDINAFYQVAKRGLGGMAISEDEKTLYVMNLYQRELLAIAIDTKTLISKIPVNNPAPTQCENDDVRPFAVAVKDGQVYIGVVCSAESSRDLNDLRAYAMRLEGTSFTTVIDYSLNFPRGVGAINADGPVYIPWQPWARTPLDGTYHWSGFPTMAVSPVFADIAFDVDGAMIMGFFDRGGHQFGLYNYPPDTSNTSTIYEGLAQGDMYRACPNGSGTWVIESNGTCGGVTTTGANNNQGQDGGEFYVGDWGAIDNGHSNSPLGGLAMIPGSGRIATTLTNPVEASARRSGVKWLSNITGDTIKGYNLNNTANARNEGFGKAGGLGDLEALGASAPIEIGNRVWLDANSNGLQDADELGIDNVEVTLSCGNNTATTTTSNDGQYYFHSLTNAIFLSAAASCSLTINSSSQSALTGYSLTTTNANGQISNHALDDGIDSDASDNAGTATIAFTVGQAGENNHSFDFGYKVAALETDLSLTKTVSPANAKPNDTVTYTLTVTNAGPATATGVQVSEVLPAGLTYQSHSGDYNPSTGIWDVGTVEVGAANAKTLTITVLVGSGTVTANP